MSRHRVVINGTYTWSDDGPAVARTHGTGNAWGTKTAYVVGQMEPILKGAVNFAESQATAVKRRERNRKANETWRTKNRAPGRGHQGKVYATEEERIEARRATWRASKERERTAGA